MAKLDFKAGQYMEWNLPHFPTDSRNTRRYFTVSSAPNDELSFTTKFPSSNESSFKKALRNLKIGDKI